MCDITRARKAVGSARALDLVARVTERLRGPGRGLLGCTIVDADEQRVRRLVEVLLDLDGGCWALLAMPTGERVAPLVGARLLKRRLHLPGARPQIHGAPVAATTGLLDDTDLIRLEHHYRLG